MMTVAKALKIVGECEEYWDYTPSDPVARNEGHLVCLDGNFSAEELEAFACLLRNKVSPRESK